MLAKLYLQKIKKYTEKHKKKWRFTNENNIKRSGTNLDILIVELYIVFKETKYIDTIALG